LGKPRGIPEEIYPIDEPIRRHDHCSREEGLRCPLYGVLDPMTKDPMTNPMMDRNGFVMDLRSWRKVFRSGAKPPFSTDAGDEDDLRELTALNYPELRLQIVNMAI
jgi:hypothetical protein